MKVDKQTNSVVFENYVLFCLAISRHRAQEAGVADMGSLTWLWGESKVKEDRSLLPFLKRLVGKA